MAEKKESDKPMPSISVWHPLLAAAREYQLKSTPPPTPDDETARKLIVITPTNTSITDILYVTHYRRTIFLSGPCDRSCDWRAAIIRLAETWGNDAVFVDPSNPNWDHTWKSDGTDPRYMEQIRWESVAMQNSTHFVVCLDGEQRLTSKFELLQAEDRPCVVYAPLGMSATPMLPYLRVVTETRHRTIFVDDPRKFIDIVRSYAGADA